MHWAAVVDLRELKFWVPTSTSCSCPWGWLLLAIVLAFTLGCCCGGCLASCFISPACRRGVRLASSLLLNLWVEPELHDQGLQLRRRFSQYRVHGA